LLNDPSALLLRKIETLKHKIVELQEQKAKMSREEATIKHAELSKAIQKLRQTPDFASNKKLQKEEQQLVWERKKVTEIMQHKALQAEWSRELNTLELEYKQARHPKTILIDRMQSLNRELQEIIEHEALQEMATAIEREADLSRQISDIKHELEKMRAGKSTIEIGKGTKYVHVFPLDLHDFTIDIKGTRIPKFISRIPGQGEHYIGTIKYTSFWDNRKNALKSFIAQGFGKVFGDLKSPPSSSKRWIISELDLMVGNTLHTIKNLVVTLSPGIPGYQVEYYYQDSNGNYYDQNDTEKQKADFLKFFLGKDISPSYAALFEATGGHETSCTKNERENLIQLGKIQLDKKTTAERMAQRFLSHIP
jgi:hypothetical protein